MKLRFQSEAEKDLFLENMQKGMILDVKDTAWIKDNNKTEHTLTFSDCIFETPSSDYYDLHWGTTPNPKNPEMISILELFSKNRAFRALIVPYVLVAILLTGNLFHLNRFKSQKVRGNAGFFFPSGSFLAYLRRTF